MESDPVYNNDGEVSSGNDVPCTTLPSATSQASEKEPIDQCSYFKIFTDSGFFCHEKISKYTKIMDAYRECGVGKDLDHPRFVLAGSRSSGKSSLLENLTGIDVSTSACLGTRFPIEINLVHDSETRTRCTIVLGETELDKARCDLFEQEYQRNNPMTREEFRDMLQEASRILGVLDSQFAHDKLDLGCIEPSVKVSGHCLRIEMRGPMFPTLTFVDTPGLPQESPDVDSKSAGQVEELVTSLIKDPRTIIIAVMDATGKIENQNIFDLAEAVDPNGTRTIGVMTKCDLVDVKNAEKFQTVLSRGGSGGRQFQHGWYLVKTRSCDEVAMSEEEPIAKIGEISKMTLPGSRTWNMGGTSGLDSDHIGIAKLREGLVDVLCARLRANLSGLHREASELLPQKRRVLGHLGPDRSTLKEQREYLKNIVRGYQRPKTLCLDYSLRSNSVSPISLLQNLASLKKDGLRMRLQKEGSIRVFQTPTTEIDDASHNAAGETNYETSDNIYTWINCRYQAMKWSAIPGLVPPALVDQLFEAQTANWSVITSDFATQVQKLVVHAIGQCLDETCQSAQVADALKELIASEVTKKFENFRTFCDGLMENERDGLHELAGDEIFVKEVQNARTIRLVGAVARLETQSAINVPSDPEVPEVPKEDISTEPPTEEPSTSETKASLPSEPTTTEPPKSFRLPNPPFGSGISTPASFPSLSKGSEGKSIFASDATLQITSPFTLNLLKSPSTPVTKPQPKPVVETPTPVPWRGIIIPVKDIPAPKFGETSKLISPFSRPSPWRKVEQRDSTAVRKEEAPSTPSIVPPDKEAYTTPSTPSIVPEENQSPPTPLNLSAQSAVSPKTPAPSPSPTPSSLATLAKENLTNLKETLSDDRQIVYQIHDILKAYYNISLQSYADAVCKTGLSRKFVREVMDVFCEEWVDGLSDELVREVGMESMKEKRVRRELKEEVEKLEDVIGEVEKILEEGAQL
ncbi:hypothetical protein BKA61DRAFT_617598 [Leptodontidium sp. MPI-SDFR-AT-0119]|nr:hypothetical protein BKA61DRAFT_617598 [Leptodontidium sp. MPI-SDFR-AT-0119]